MSFQRFAGRLVLVLSALVLAAPAMADELFAIRGVEVDVEAADASQAREAAIAMGQSRALQRLWGRLIPADMAGRAPSLSAEQTANLVEDFSVSDEHSGERSYSGKLNVRFYPGEVRRVLREANIPYAEQRGPTLLVLPLFSDDAGTRLWDDPNPWHEAWGRRSETGLVPIQVPLGDLGDIGAIDTARAEQLDRSALDAIAGIYDAEEVLVTNARLSGDPESGQAGLSIEMRRVGPGRDGGMEMESVRQQEGEPAQRFYERAVAAVDRRVQEEWKQANALRFDDQRELLVRVPIRGLEDWVQVRRQLRETARVVDHEILHLSRQEGVLSLSYVGDEAQLARALARGNLTLENVPPGQSGMPEWRLSLGGPAPEEQGTSEEPRQSGGGEARSLASDAPRLQLPSGAQ